MTDRETIEQLRETLIEAKRKLEEQQEYINSLQADSRTLGICIDIIGKYVLVAVDGTVVKMRSTGKIAVGDIVLIHDSPLEGAMIVDTIKTRVLGTQIATFVRYTSNQSAIVSFEGKERKVIVTLPNIEVGSQVAVDDMGICILEDLGLQKKPVTTDTINVPWAAVGGHTKAKQALQEMIEWPHQYKELYKQYGKRPTKGVLLFGPPGCGKTLLAKAAATSISKDGKALFLYVKGPELLSMWVGEGERQVRELFARARENKNATLFIDEADAILAKRGTRSSTNISDTMVPAFLAEMDGLDAGGPVIILATNRQDMLDDAVVREGRIDRKVYVGRPTPVDALSIFTMYLARTKTTESAETMAAKATHELFHGNRTLFRCQHEDGNTSIIELADVVSGAMIETIVDQSRARAIAHDVINKSQRASGVSMEHIIATMEDVVESHKHTNSDDVFVAHEERHGKITSIVRAA